MRDGTADVHGHVDILDCIVVGAVDEEIGDERKGQRVRGRCDILDGLCGRDQVSARLGADGCADAVPGFEEEDEDAEADVAVGAGEEYEWCIGLDRGSHVCLGRSGRMIGTWMASDMKQISKLLYLLPQTTAPH